MGAAKSAQVIIAAYNYEERGQVAVCMKPIQDTRTKSTIESRLGISREALLLREHDDPYVMIDGKTINGQPIDVIIVDEVQFLTSRQIWRLAVIVDKLKIPVLCYGLRADFKGNLFPGSAKLMAIADNIHEIKTMCHCGKKAIMNARIVDGNIVTEGEQIVIGSNESYVALCRSCYCLNTLREG